MSGAAFVDVIGVILYYGIPKGDLTGEDVCNLKLCSKQLDKLIDWKTASKCFELFDPKKVKSNWVTSAEPVCDDCGYSGWKLCDMSSAGPRTICFRCRGAVEVEIAMRAYRLCDEDRKSLPIAIIQKKGDYEPYGWIFVTDPRAIIGRSLLRHGEAVDHSLQRGPPINAHIPFLEPGKSVVEAPLVHSICGPGICQKAINSFNTANLLMRIRENLRNRGERSARRCRLLKELSKHGLSLRLDSRLCRRYINGTFANLEEVVLMMVEMNWFVLNTEYQMIVRQLYENSGAKSRRSLRNDIRDSAEAKRVALKSWGGHISTLPESLRRRLQCRMKGGHLGQIGGKITN